MSVLFDMPGLFIQDCKLRLLKAMEFRLEFFTGIITSLAFSCIVPLFQFLIYKNTRGYPGWTFDEILLFQAVLLFWIGFTDTIFGDIKPLMEATIQYGLFDRYLIFPYPPLVILLTRGFNYRSTGTLLAGIIALTYAFIKLSISLTWWRIVLFLVYFAAGILLYLALLILYCTIALRLVYVLNLSVVLDKIIQLGNWPVEIFSGTLKIISFSVLPIAIWINIPCRILLGHLEVTAVFSLIPALILFIVSLILWNKNLKNYTSAGG